MEENKTQEELPEQAPVQSEATESASPIENEQELMLLKLQSELEEAKDKYLRQVAEFDNYRRRTLKESQELRATAGKDVIISLLEILDDAERAEKQLTQAQDIEALKEGFVLVFQKLRDKMLARGVKPMESIGLEFNPDTQEAIAEVPASEEMKGKVIDEVSKGYFLNDKIIRFAKVVVGN